MKDSWTSQLVGQRVKAVEQWEGCPCVIVLADGYRVHIESLWRLVTRGALALTSRDETQLFGGNDPVRAIPELSSRLVDRTLTSVQVSPGTADLTLHFGEMILQIISESSGYEAWQVEGQSGTVAVGQGGGNVAVWG